MVGDVDGVLGPAAPPPAPESADRPQRALGRLREVKSRTLTEITDYVQLTNAMLDAIQAHKRLLEDANILHGDVNINTVLIVDHPDGRAEGALVDFDLPVEMPAAPRVGDPHPVQPARTARPYYWRAPGV